MDLKKRLKQEAGYVGRGAKIIGKNIGKKIVASGKAWWKQQQEIGRQQRKATLKARKKRPKASNTYDDVLEILLGSKDKD